MMDLTPRAGDLDLMIWIESAPEIQSDTGQLIVDWNNVSSSKPRWARYVNLGTRTFRDASQQFSDMQWLIEARGWMNVTPRMRIRTNETPPRYLQILGAYAGDGRQLSTAECMYIAVREQPVWASANANQVG